MATNSKYSHVGIITVRNDEYFVFEAVQPVKLTPLKKWIIRGEDSHFVLKRLLNRDKYFTDKNVKIMRETGEKFKGKMYDIYFNWTDDEIYCSELVWKIYNSIGLEIGKLQRLKEFNLDNNIVKQKLIERYGSDIPYNEVVISPAAIFNSKLLELVIKN